MDGSYFSVMSITFAIVLICLAFLLYVKMKLHPTNVPARWRHDARRSLARLEKQLGPWHPDVAQALNRLAGLMREDDRYEEAEQLYRRALAILKKACGERHEATARTMYHLAVLHFFQGRVDEAWRLLDRALAIQEQLLGPQHLDVADTLFEMAVRCQDDEPSKGENCFRRVIAIREQATNADDADVVFTRTMLASLLREQGALEAAEEQLLLARLAYEKQPPCDNLISVLKDLAWIYRKWGSHARAEELLMQALALSESHNEAYCFYVALEIAELCENVNSLSDAETWYKRALAYAETSERTTMHFSVTNAQVIRSVLANFLDRQGRHEDAHELYEAVLNRCEQRILRAAGKYPVEKDVLQHTAMLASLGRTHHGEDWPRASTRLQRVLDICSKTQEIAEAGLAMAADRDDASGARIPAHMIYCLAGMHDCLGRHDVAKGLCERGIDVLTRLCGPEAAYTLALTDLLRDIHSDRQRQRPGS